MGAEGGCRMNLVPNLRQENLAFAKVDLFPIHNAQKWPLAFRLRSSGDVKDAGGAMERLRVKGRPRYGTALHVHEWGRKLVKLAR